jgi:hypothetical protein
MLGAAPGVALASSHREAPLITETPKLDGTDFYLFRSYEPGRSAFVTMVANYIPLQDPFGGPNYFTMDPNAVYDINIDNQGTATPAMTFRFRFTTVDRGLTVSVGGKNVPVALTELAPISSGVPATENVVETYTLSLVTYVNGQPTETPITTTTGASVFGKPVDNIGHKTIPDYAAYAASFMYDVKIPGCATPGRLFAGQRKESFVVNLGETFDLVNYKHPVGEQFVASARNSLADKNITSLELEVPIACLRTAADPVIAGWTTSASVVPNGNGPATLQQASRLANPLVNELVIGLPNKDMFNASQPIGDPRFLTYVTNPSFPAILELLTGLKAPTLFPRADLVAVFLTGLTGLNKPVNLQAPGEEMRLNTDIAPVARDQQNPLGVIGGDAAGYPNGRRPGDDVVDITLRVAMGKLFTGNTALFGTPSDAPSGELAFTDGAFVDAKFFDDAFPYLKTPIAGSPQDDRDPDGDRPH